MYAHQELARFHCWENEDIQLCIKHFKVAASAGDKESMDTLTLMKMYKDKLLSKENLTQALRAFQTSENAMKSKDRDDARAAKSTW